MSAPPNHASDALNDADFDLQGVHDAADVARLATRLYGDAPLDAEGVLHVTAIDGNSGRTLRIDDHAPKSHADAFALNLARARADAIVITGKILRDEPKLSYAPGAPGPTTPAFTAFRAALGRTSRPLLVVMTRGANLPLEHPVFHGGDVRALIYGPESGVAALRAQTNADVVGTPGEARLSDLIAYLRARDAVSISFEAGPSTTRHLYDAPTPLLDELCLSTYAGPALPSAQLAGEPPAVPPQLALGHAPATVLTPGGPWRFARYLRAATG